MITTAHPEHSSGELKKTKNNNKSKTDEMQVLVSFCFIGSEKKGISMILRI